MSIKIKYEIQSVPNKDQIEDIYYYLEGKIIIYINNKIFLDIDYILLLEFAACIIKWLHNCIKLENFYYSSMELEEEPIFELIYKGNNKFTPYSIWQNFESNDLIDYKEIKKEFLNYILSIKNYLFKSWGKNINIFLIRTTNWFNYI